MVGKTVTTKSATPASATRDMPIAERQALDALLDETAGQGMEEASADDYSVPFLRILQDLSPQVKKLKPEFIVNAKPGMIFNTSTKELYEKIRVAPCYYRRTYIEWRPRSDGGGLIAVHDVIEGLKLMATTRRGEGDQSGKQILPNGNELAETQSHYVLLLKDDDTFEGCVIAMAATQLKTSKNWNTQRQYSTRPTAQRQKGYATYAWQYEIGSKEDGNDKGSWYSWTIGAREQLLNIEALKQAKAFHDLLETGRAKVDYEQMREPAGRTFESDGDGSPRNDIDA